MIVGYLLGGGLIALALLPGARFAATIRVLRIPLGHGIRLVGRIRIF